MISNVKRFLGDRSGAVTPLMAITSLFVLTFALAAYDAASYASMKKQVEAAAQSTADVVAHTEWGAADPAAVRARAQQIFELKRPRDFETTNFNHEWTPGSSKIDVRGRVALIAAGTQPIRAISEVGKNTKAGSNQTIYIPIVFNMGNGTINDPAAPTSSNMIKLVDAVRRKLETEIGPANIKIGFVPFTELAWAYDPATLPSAAEPEYHCHGKYDSPRDLLRKPWRSIRRITCTDHNKLRTLAPLAPSKTVGPYRPDYARYVQANINGGFGPKRVPASGCTDAEFGLTIGYKLAADQIAADKGRGAEGTLTTIVVFLTDQLPSVEFVMNGVFKTPAAASENRSVCKTKGETKVTADRNFDPGQSFKNAIVEIRDNQDVEIIGVNATGKTFPVMQDNLRYLLNVDTLDKIDVDRVAADVTGLLQNALTTQYKPVLGLSPTPLN